MTSAPSYIRRAAGLPGSMRNLEPMHPWTRGAAAEVASPAAPRAALAHAASEAQPLRVDMVAPADREPGVREEGERAEARLADGTRPAPGGIGRERTAAESHRIDTPEADGGFGDPEGGQETWNETHDVRREMTGGIGARAAKAAASVLAADGRRGGRRSTETGPVTLAGDPDGRTPAASRILETATPEDERDQTETGLAALAGDRGASPETASVRGRGRKPRTTGLVETLAAAGGRDTAKGGRRHTAAAVRATAIETRDTAVEAIADAGAGGRVFQRVAVARAPRATNSDVANVQIERESVPARSTRRARNAGDTRNAGDSREKSDERAEASEPYVSRSGLPRSRARRGERSRDIHVGSLEIRVVAPQQQAPAQQRVNTVESPRATAAAPAAPLARGFSSIVGLRQG